MNRTTKHIKRRFNRILGSARNVRPGSDTIRELVDLSFALEDEPVRRADVVARMTVTRANNEKLIVEIYDNATYSSFYHFFSQQGAKRSTKRHTRTASRYEAPGLESLSSKLAYYQFASNPIVHTKIRIIRRRAYRRLISARPDELGLTRCPQVPIYRPVPAGRA